MRKVPRYLTEDVCVSPPVIGSDHRSLGVKKCDQFMRAFHALKRALLLAMACFASDDWSGFVQTYHSDDRVVHDVDDIMEVIREALEQLDELVMLFDELDQFATEDTFRTLKKLRQKLHDMLIPFNLAVMQFLQCFHAEPRNAALNYTHVFSPYLHDQLRFPIRQRNEAYFIGKTVQDALNAHANVQDALDALKKMNVQLAENVRKALFVK